MDNIVKIILLFENGDEIEIKNSECLDFYISNFNENGEEIPYTKTIINGKLSSNFCLIELTKNLKEEYIKRIKCRNDITDIKIILENGKSLLFDMPTDADPFAANYNNSYQYTKDGEKSLGVILSKYKIKYLDNMFI